MAPVRLLALAGLMSAAALTVVGWTASATAAPRVPAATSRAQGGGALAHGEVHYAGVPADRQAGFLHGVLERGPEAAGRRPAAMSCHLSAARPPTRPAKN
jgi:hypothetical protein